MGDNRDNSADSRFFGFVPRREIMGRALAVGLSRKEKKVDMVMVHAPAAEKKAVSDGWAIKRTLIGSNEFYLVRPK